MLAQTLLHAAGEGTSSDSCHTGMGGLAAQGQSITHLPTVLQETVYLLTPCRALHMTQFMVLSLPACCRACWEISTVEMQPGLAIVNK